MKILFFLLTFSTLSWAQNENSRNLLTEKAPCTFEMTIDQLTSDKLYFKCSEAFNNKPFEIQNFVIKFIGHASIPVFDDSLNLKAREIAKNLNVGDYVTIFHIENLIVDNNETQNYKTLLIQIVE